MRNTSNYQLYINLLKHIAHMHNDVDYRRAINAYMINARGAKRKQYPAASVGAECNSAECIGNQHTNAMANDFDPILLNALLSKYSRLNIKDNISGNYVGHCAENYAATGVLEKLRNTRNLPTVLSEIGFTDAFQPRTCKMMDWCAICHNIFD